MKAKYAFAIFAIVILIAIPVVSADLVGDILKGIDTVIPLPDVITNDATSIVDQAIVVTYNPDESPFKPVKLPPSPRANYEYKGWDATTQFLTALWGGKTNVSFITVVINGTQVATIKSDSPFMNRPIHTYCLQYQYGTENWDKCEASYQ